MKKLILASALLALGAVEASAQWGAPPPGAWRHSQPYNWCAEKAHRLHEFEFRMTRDGRISRDEARIAESLRFDLQRHCGGGRWHPDRGWHYR